MSSITSINVCRSVFPTSKSTRSHVKNSRSRATQKQYQTQCTMLPQNNRMVVAEKLNGRMAMLGYLAGSGYESMTGMNYLDQVQTTYPFVIGMGMVIGYATLKTRNLEVVEQTPFTTTLELLNGRMAMMGILAKLVYDSGVLHI